MLGCPAAAAGSHAAAAPLTGTRPAVASPVQAVVLLHTRQVEGPEGVAPLLAEGLALAGLPPANPSAWLDFEVQRLREGARKAAGAGDQVTAFLYRQVVMCLLAHVSACWDAPPPPPAAAADDAAAAADDGTAPQPEASDGSAAAGVATPPAEASTPQKSGLSDSGSLPPGDCATPQRDGSGDASPSQQPPSSQAARFRQLMGAWSAGRTSSGSSPQQAPQPPGATPSRAASPLSGACAAAGGVVQQRSAGLAVSTGPPAGSSCSPPATGKPTLSTAPLVSCRARAAQPAAITCTLTAGPTWLPPTCPPPCRGRAVQPAGGVPAGGGCRRGAARPGPRQPPRPGARAWRRPAPGCAARCWAGALGARRPAGLCRCRVARRPAAAGRRNQPAP